MKSLIRAFLSIVTAVVMVAGCTEHVAPKPHTRTSYASQSGDAQSTYEPQLEEIIGPPCSSETVLSGDPLSFSLEVAADSYWTSSGVYVKPGVTVDIQASGSWTIWQDQTPEFGPGGHPGLSDHNGCKKGSLVAQIGLSREPTIHCVGEGASFVAKQAGILYFAMNDSASPAFHAGTISANVTAQALEAPLVSYEEAATYSYCDVPSGFVEIASREHFLFTVPTAIADAHREDIVETLDFFDRVYGHQKELAGGVVPFEGYRIRLAPDFALRGVAWIQADNPMLFDPANLNAVDPSRSAILRSADPQFSVFELLRGIGVSFSRSRGGRYQFDDKTAQAFGGLFAIHALEREDRDDIFEQPCYRRASHVDTGDFDAFASDGLIQLCLLLDIRDRFGDAIFQAFFDQLPEREEWDSILPATSSSMERWQFIYDRLTLANPEDGATPVAVDPTVKAGGGDLESIFSEFHVFSN